MNQILLGVFFGVLGLGIIAFLLAALLSVRKLTFEISGLRAELKDGLTTIREGIVLLRPLKEVIEDSIEEFADRMGEATKELRGVSRIGSSLETHTDQCKALGKVGEDFITHCRALTALLGAVYGVMVRPGMVPPEHVDIPPPAAPPAKTPTEPEKTTPIDTPPPPPADMGADFSSFHPFNDEDAALREAEVEAKRMGVPIAEDPENAVPKDQMVDGGNV